MNAKEVKAELSAIEKEFNGIIKQNEVFAQLEELRSMNYTDEEAFALIREKLSKALEQIPEEDRLDLIEVEEEIEDLIENNQEIMSIFAKRERIFSWKELNASKEHPAEFLVQIHKKSMVKSKFQPEVEMWNTTVYKPLGSGYSVRKFKMFPFQSLLTQIEKLGIELNQKFIIVYTGEAISPEGNKFHSCYVEVV